MLHCFTAGHLVLAKKPICPFSHLAFKEARWKKFWDSSCIKGQGQSVLVCLFVCLLVCFFVCFNFPANDLQMSKFLKGCASVAWHPVMLVPNFTSFFYSSLSSLSFLPLKSKNRKNFSWLDYQLNTDTVS